LEKRLKTLESQKQEFQSLQETYDFRYEGWTEQMVVSNLEIKRLEEENKVLKERLLRK
jgi:hypothetical protein